jgi:hypothetical protein
MVMVTVTTVTTTTPRRITPPQKVEEKAMHDPAPQKQNITSTTTTTMTTTVPTRSTWTITSFPCPITPMGTTAIAFAAARPQKARNHYSLTMPAMARVGCSCLGCLSRYLLLLRLLLFLPLLWGV